MYALTICKIEKDTNIFVDQNLTMGLEGDVFDALEIYGVEFEHISRGEKFYKVIEWYNYKVSIQYLKVS
jgi:hypothetical protein